MTNKRELPGGIIKEIKGGISAMEKLASDSFNAAYTEINGLKVQSFEKTPVPGHEALFATFDNAINKKITNRNLPALYVFEYENATGTRVFDTFSRYKQSQGSKPTPAVKINPPLHSPTLYIGKSETDVVGRLFVHFGYYPKSESGLQLIHWADEIDLIVNIKIWQFEPEFRNYLKVLEKPLNYEFNPLIGHL
ncbi:MAG: hypothetical protein JNL57_10775 [Bacteroidetes bacterium]|nr:hypothetical protein [Bacteroidota bacterium]